MELNPDYSTLSNLFTNSDLISEIMNFSTIKKIERNTEILREGQNVKAIPIVLDGLIKVFTGNDDKELLLYYIKPMESCIMLLSAGLANETSSVYAITEEDSTVILLPIDKVAKWIKQYPEINTLFFQQYNLRYTDLLNTIHSVIFNKMDERLYKYLKNIVELTGNNPIKISHRQIAVELGTAREVISRVMKRLESEGKIQQLSNSIKILQ